jgi:hypothetical protein
MSEVIKLKYIGRGRGVSLLLVKRSLHKRDFTQEDFTQEDFTQEDFIQEDFTQKDFTQKRLYTNCDAGVWGRSPQQVEVHAEGMVSELASDPCRRHVLQLVINVKQDGFRVRPNLAVPSTPFLGALSSMFLEILLYKKMTKRCKIFLVM